MAAEGYTKVQIPSGKIIMLKNVMWGRLDIIVADPWKLKPELSRYFLLRSFPVNFWSAEMARRKAKLYLFLCSAETRRMIVPNWDFVPSYSDWRESCRFLTKYNLNSSLE